MGDEGYGRLMNDERGVVNALFFRVDPCDPCASNLPNLGDLGRASVAARGGAGFAVYGFSLYGRLRARGAAEGTGEKNKKNKRACGVGPAVPRPYFILLPPYGPLLQVPLLRCRPPRGACAAAARRGRGAVGGRVRVRCAACCGVLTGRTAS